MGKRYEQHSDMCGCERCARQWESENPMPVFDEVDDPEYKDCGCSIYFSCECDYYDSFDCEECE